jgi:hypothetical protein
MMQAGTCVHEVEELGFVTAGGRTQGHQAGAIGLVSGRRWCFLAMPGGRGLTLVNHKRARYRPSVTTMLGPLSGDNKTWESVTTTAGNR